MGRTSSVQLHSEHPGKSAPEDRATLWDKHIQIYGITKQYLEYGPKPVPEWLCKLLCSWPGSNPLSSHCGTAWQVHSIVLCSPPASLWDALNGKQTQIHLEFCTHFVHICHWCWVKTFLKYSPIWSSLFITIIHKTYFKITHSAQCWTCYCFLKHSPPQWYFINKELYILSVSNVGYLAYWWYPVITIANNVEIPGIDKIPDIFLSKGKKIQSIWKIWKTNHNCVQTDIYYQIFLRRSIKTQLFILAFINSIVCIHAFIYSSLVNNLSKDIIHHSTTACHINEWA